uniref:Uncharacterized protein n=1 Tax=Rousettus aegyptiacus TaxID=9407 RepID=A0A7J8F0B6_ROUAE|nr:hypothetical protein HJG63_012337 [Rousettus aegyptiacus]
MLYLVVVLICISLIASEVELLLLYLLAMCLSSEKKKMSLWVLCSFFNWIFLSLLSYMSSLHILDLSPLVEVSFAYIFSPLVSCLLFCCLLLLRKSFLVSYNPRHLFLLLLPLLLGSSSQKPL